MHATEGVFERDPEIVSQIGATRRALATTAASLAAHKIAEKIVKHIRKRAGEITLTAARARAATHATFERGMTIAVVRCLLVVVFQNFVSLIGLLELLFCFRVVRIAVWMQFFGF